MLPFLNPHIVKIELLHNFSYDKKGMEFFGLANHGYLNYRMVIDGFTFDNIKNQYKEYNVDIRYLDRVVIAEYGVDVPPPIAKPPVPPMKILYAGRGTKQKRVWLIDKIAQHFLKASANVQFTFAGPLDNELSADVKQHSNVLGEVDAGRMQKLFTQNHVIILTSAFEGFPVVVKQGMASGCVPIVTALPANKIHLKHLSNALLIEQPDDENHVIEEAIRNIKLLAEDPTLLNTLSFHTYEYARQNFGKDNFRHLYHDLLTR
jgi:glycosyltransferase involved in cell wall biosynthesis